jgi:hypothetical protein
MTRVGAQRSWHCISCTKHRTDSLGKRVIPSIGRPGNFQQKIAATKLTLSLNRLCFEPTRCRGNKSPIAISLLRAPRHQTRFAFVEPFAGLVDLLHRMAARLRLSAASRAGEEAVRESVLDLSEKKELADYNTTLRVCAMKSRRKRRARKQGTGLS